MAHTGTITGLNIPDPGDPHQTSDQRVSAYLDALELHTHTGEDGDYQQIPAAGLGIDGNVSWNANGITGLTYLTLTTIVPATMPVNSIGKDSAGDVYWRPGSGSAVQITNGSALNTASGSGWVGLSTPARATYNPADGFYEVYEDFGNTLRGRFASAGLRLRERISAPGNYCDIVVPAGWDAAAVADPTLSVQPQALISAIAAGAGIVSPGPEVATEAIGSWTPSVAGSMDTETYTEQTGIWVRLGNVVIAWFSAAWTGGTNLTDWSVTGLPFGESSTTVRGLTSPAASLNPLVGQAYDTVNTDAYFCKMAGSAIRIRSTTTGDPITAPAAGDIRGQVMFLASP